MIRKNCIADYSSTKGYHENKLREKKIFDILNSYQENNEIEKNLMESYKKFLTEKFVSDMNEFHSKNPTILKNKQRELHKKLLNEKMKSSLKTFMCATSYNALNLDKDVLNENNKEIVAKIKEFYTEAFDQGLLSLESFKNNKYEMIRDVYNLLEGEHNQQIHIHIYNGDNESEDKKEDKKDEKSESEDKKDESSDELNLDADLDDDSDESSDDELNLDADLDDDSDESSDDELDLDADLDDDSDESSDDELDLDADLDDDSDKKSDEKPSKEKPAKETKKKSEEDEEDLDLEFDVEEKKKPATKKEKKAVEKAEKISKETSTAVKSKVNEVLASEKEAAKKIKETEKTMKEEGQKFSIKTEVSLFKSILMNSQSKFLNENRALYESDNSKFMDTVLNNSIITYTLLETLNTMGMIPNTPDYVRYVSGRLRRV